MNSITQFEKLKVAAIQRRAVYREIKKTIPVIADALIWAESEQVDILCFPECYLQGYLLNHDAPEFSMDLNSLEFQDLLHALPRTDVTFIIGLIEKEEDRLYNTAVVIDQNKLAGKYRKQHLLKKEKIFTAGSSSPIFERRGVKFGINICSDARYVESAQELAEQGAQIIFYPLNNSLPPEIAQQWKDKHIENLAKIALETSCWIVSADVVEESASQVGYGCTAVVDPTGKVVKYLPHSQEDKLSLTLE